MTIFTDIHIAEAGLPEACFRLPKVIGQEFCLQTVDEPRPAAAPSTLRLPFGMSAPTRPRAKKQERQTPTANTAAETQKEERLAQFESKMFCPSVCPAVAVAVVGLAHRIPRQPADATAHAAETELAPCILSAQAAAELDEAMKLHESASALSLEAAAPDAAGAASSCSRPEGPSPRLGELEADVASQVSDGRSVASSRQRKALPFQTRLGILTISVTKRGGVKCFHCSSSIPKGDFRFEYAHDINKPNRSIHPTCLAQINMGACMQNSIRTLQKLVTDALSERERSICREALATLQLAA